MKKFIEKIVLIVMIVSVLIFAINSIFVKNYAGDDSDGTLKYKNVPENIQVCNFGSSHGVYGFDYENHTDCTCFNFALVSQSLAYDDKILNNYKQNISSGATVFIVVSYFSLYGEPEVESNDFVSKNARYYKFLPAKYIIDYNPKMALLSDFPVLTQYENLVRAAGTIVKNGPTNDVFSGWEDTSADNDNLEEVGLKRAENHVMGTHVDKNGKLIHRQESFDAISDIISVCNNIGAHPVLITMPYTKYYVEGVDKSNPKFFETFYADINEIIHKTGVDYYDYSHDDRFYDHPELFMDTDHLNKKGAEKFTDILFDEIVNK